MILLTNILLLMVAVFNALGKLPMERNNIMLMEYLQRIQNDRSDYLQYNSVDELPEENDIDSYLQNDYLEPEFNNFKNEKLPTSIQELKIKKHMRKPKKDYILCHVKKNYRTHDSNQMEPRRYTDHKCMEFDGNLTIENWHNKGVCLNKNGECKSAEEEISYLIKNATGCWIEKKVVGASCNECTHNVFEFPFKLIHPLLLEVKQSRGVLGNL